MQSIFQHRHLREAVERDLSACQAKPHKSATGSSTPEITLVSDNEKEGDATTPTPMVAGVQASRPAEGDGKITFLVGWKDDDIHNPRNWSLVKKWWTTIIVTLIGGALCIPSSIEAPVTNAFDEYYNVGPIAGSMTTGIYLIGFGVGSLFAGPFSETFGRNLVYIGSIVLFMIFTMAKALAPNFGAAIAFRFLAAFFGSPPLTCTGGSIADIWNPLHITFGLPFYTMVAYAGPIAGPIIGAYLPGVGFRWADWISLIISGAMLIVVILALPETYSPLLLEWKASHFRELTGDSRYQVNEHASLRTLGQHLITNVYRPFLMTYTEPIILVFSFYLTILYIVLFTFLNGYPYIFQETYGITEPLTYILWCGMLAGDGVALMLIPVVYGWTKKAVAKAEANGKEVEPEVCMYWSMMGGSFFLPISLFWMGWTCYPGVSIWSPIVGSFVFGYGLVTVFTTTYLYICFVYTRFAASALVFLSFSRYVISGALIPASIPMYQNLGPHYTLTMLGCIMTLMAPVPFLGYRYGHKIRAMSKNVQNKN